MKEKRDNGNSLAQSCKLTTTTPPPTKGTCGQTCRSGKKNSHTDIEFIKNDKSTCNIFQSAVSINTTSWFIVFVCSFFPKPNCQKQSAPTAASLHSFPKHSIYFVNKWQCTNFKYVNVWVFFIIAAVLNCWKVSQNIHTKENLEASCLLKSA